MPLKGFYNKFNVHEFYMPNLDSFITHVLIYEVINKAFDLKEERKSLQCTIWMVSNHLLHQAIRLDQMRSSEISINIR